MLPFVLEAVDHLVAGGRRHAAVILQGTEPGELPLQPAECLHPLAEDECLPAACLHLLEFCHEAIELRALARRRIEVADLLEPEDEFEHILDRRLLAEGRQPQHPLLLGPAVGLSLFGSEFDALVAVHPRWHLGEHLVFRTPQHIVGRRGAQRLGRHAVVDMAGRHEVEEGDEILGGVFHRRAGERPAAAALQPGDGPMRVARTVFDPLCLVEHDEIERKAQFLDHLAIPHHRLVVGDLHRHVGKRPLPAAPQRIPFDHRHDQFGGPVSQFTRPVRNEPLRADHEHPPRLPAADQQPQRRDRLHRFAEAHLVGQDRAMPRHEKGHAVELKGKRLPRKFEVARLERRLQIRLQHEEEPLGKLDDVAWWRDSRSPPQRGGMVFRPLVSGIHLAPVNRRRPGVELSSRGRGIGRLGKTMTAHPGPRVEQGNPHDHRPRMLAGKPHRLHGRERGQVLAGDRAGWHHEFGCRDRSHRRPPTRLQHDGSRLA